MGRLFVINLEGNIYSCKYCSTHLALADDIISKAFHCKHGRAYLFDKVVNVTCGPKEERLMMTGWHSVVDIFCVCCGSIVGWKYERAYDKSQKYKEGKSILERFKVIGPDGSSYQMNLIPNPNQIPNLNLNQNQEVQDEHMDEDEDEDEDEVDDDDDQMA